MNVSFESLWRRMGEIAHEKRQHPQPPPIRKRKPVPERKPAVLRTRTVCCNGHALTEATRYVTPKGYVSCVICRREAARRGMAKIRKA